jgi:acetyl esterase/lipase
MVSKQMQNLTKLLLNNQAKEIKKRVEDARKELVDLSNLVKIAKDVKLEFIKVDNIPAAWISTPETKNQYVILYLHGGGYMEGSIKTHQELVSRIARVAKARALMLDYRLAPENIFPAALDDAFAGYHWLIKNEKINPKNIIIAGDSAGGGLTIATLLKLRDSGSPLPAAAIGISPWTDLAMTGESLRKNAKKDVMLAYYNLYFMAFLYLDDVDPKNPLVSPLYADLKGLPPILIQVGDAEVLLDDSIRFADRAKKAGVNITLDIWKDMPHVFQSGASLAPEGQQAIDKMGIFIQKFFK